MPFACLIRVLGPRDSYSLSLMSFLDVVRTGRGSQMEDAYNMTSALGRDADQTRD